MNMSVDIRNGRKLSGKRVVAFAFVAAAILLQSAKLVTAAAPTERIVTVRRPDVLIQLHDGKGQVEKSLGGVVAVGFQGASKKSPNFRVAVGDVLGAGTQQVLTAVENSKDAWRVERLTSDNDGSGLIRSYACLFTIANYRPYGYFSSTARCELPGKRFIAKASGAAGDRHNFISPAGGTPIAVYRYKMLDGRLYAAWRVKAPRKRVEGGRFSDVRSSDGRWNVWCNLDNKGRLVWTVQTIRGGKPTTRSIQAKAQADGWVEMQLTLAADTLTLQINQKNRGNFAHDAYGDAFFLQFGSSQPKPGGGEVVSEFREIFVNSIPYPYKGIEFAEGPEDIRPEDNAVVGFVYKTTPQFPRVSEGDIIETDDGKLLAVYSFYYDGSGWDSSPARLVGSLSGDGGRTWGKQWTVANRDEGSHGNVMSVSLARGKNGDLIMVYHDRMPSMKAKGMVARRSSDEGRTWSKRVPVTPADSPNRHIANNACLTRLACGRLVLATREYCPDARWPYARYSDDDGRTWRSGSHVPDAGLTPRQKSAQNLNEPSICQLADGRLLMTARSVAGGQFFAWSKDKGQTWTKPILSPLRGACSPAIVRSIPSSDHILAVWTYGYGGRTPLVSAVSKDGGLTWLHLKLLEQSQYHGYCYASCNFVGDRAVLSYMHYPMFSSIFRFEGNPGYHDSRFISLPIKWFYRDLDSSRN